MRNISGTLILTLVSLFSTPTVFDFAAAQPAECSVVPPICDQKQKLSIAYSNSWASKIQGTAATNLPTHAQYCTMWVLNEALGVCLAEYLRAGKPQCATLIRQQIAVDKQAMDQAAEQYKATSAQADPDPKQGCF